MWCAHMNICQNLQHKFARFFKSYTRHAGNICPLEVYMQIIGIVIYLEPETAAKLQNKKYLSLSEKNYKT